MSLDVGLEFVLNQLTDIVKENYDLIKSLDKNIQNLNTELEFLKSYVEDLQKKDKTSNSVKTLVKKIKTVVWKSEDLVESIALEVTMYRSYDKVFPRYWSRWKRASDVTSIIADIKKIRNEHLPSAIIVSEGSASGSSTRDADQYIEEAVVEEFDVVGFEEAIKEVETIIHEGSDQLEIAAIVGMLGLGKTTLANKVFMNPINEKKFSILAFIYVSRDYSRRDVFFRILQSFTTVSEELRRMRLQDLQSYVRKELEKYPYLIVLDDVWDTDTWDALRHVFPTNNLGSRVLITTRNEIVATHASDIEPHRLKFLSTEKSRELLCQRVFGFAKCPRDDLIIYEKKIATKCGGLPLAIVVIAGILLNHRDVEFWKNVAQHGRIIPEDEEKITQMTGVVELMYKHLPGYMKHCFLYLGVFREDVEIPVWKVVRLWIAEGIVQPAKGVRSEDRAEAFLQQLISRNLVIVVEKRKNDDVKIKSVRIHDALRDFCKTKAMEECVFHEVSDCKLGVILNKLQSLSDCRRLSINANDPEGTERYISKISPYDHVRSFLCFSKKTIDAEATTVERLTKNIKDVRVLEIQPLLFKTLPARLSKLTFVKYLCVSLHKVGEIPTSFSCMIHMQTLIAYTTSNTLEIKADIWKMPHFRHLHTDKPTILPTPTDNKGGDDVQTLSAISPQRCPGDVLKRVPNIRKLGIWGDLAQLGSTMLDHLRGCESLESLKIRNDIDQICHFTGLPSHDKLPINVTKISLSNTRLAWKDQMSKLGKLKVLTVLKLKDDAFEGPEWTTNDGEFPRLQHLHIEKSDLASWVVTSPHHFPQLKTLILNTCTKLEKLSPQIGAIPCSLRSVSLHYTNHKLVNSARQVFDKTVELSIRGGQD